MQEQRFSGVDAATAEPAAALSAETSRHGESGVKEEKDAEDCCAICLEPLSALPCHTTPCEHVFHTACYAQHVAASGRHANILPGAGAGADARAVLCPLCRRADASVRAPFRLANYLPAINRLLLVLYTVVSAAQLFTAQGGYAYELLDNIDTAVRMLLLLMIVVSKLRGE